MCGISGIVKLRGGRVDPARLRSMISTLAHRGPDGNGIHTSDASGVGLAHARLSIIDIAGGAQPMSIDNGRLWITFNGEIFNYVELREELLAKGHVFSSRSDTEVILHLYQEEGENCVNKMNGQWALAIWDEKRRKLFVSRDRLGVRPLFFTLADDSFLFASEIKALFACPEIPRQLDLQALDQFFTFWAAIAPRTAFKGISQLPPGHSLVVENGEVRVWQYWCLDYPAEDGYLSGQEQELAHELLDLLRDATRIRLRSDVPVGAYLSGGIDSTVTTALARSLVGDRLRSFSVSFEDSEFDESAYQKEAVEYLGTQHSDVRCTYDAIAQAFPDMIRHAEQPVLRTAPAPLFHLAKLVRSSGYKVVLTGEGADEMLGGYDIFKELKIRRFWGRNLDSRLRPMLLKRLYPYMDGIQRQPTAYLKSFFHVSAEDLANPYFSHLPRWELTAKLKSFFTDEARSEIRPGLYLEELAAKLPTEFHSWGAFNRAEFLEAAFFLPGYILSAQGDRMAMAHSVEGRFPFLDHRVVSFAGKLPPRLKMKVLNQKYLLKLAVEGLIPPRIQKRYKQPYRAPDGKSFFAKPVPYVDEMLSAASVKRFGVFQPQMVAGLVGKFKSGRPTSTKDNMALVGILSTQLLLAQFVHGIEIPALHRRPIPIEAAV